MGTEKHVWILGAGFSRSLGGPLIEDLLAEMPHSVLQARAPNITINEQREGFINQGRRARAFCAWGLRKRYWRDAEEFIDKVETARHDEKESDGGKSDSTLVMKAMLQGIASDEDGLRLNFSSLQELCHAARRAILVDCWSFLRGAGPKVSRIPCPERWAPYVDWAKSLTANDTVVTFNYDAVPELLRDAGAPLAVVLPSAATKQAGEVRTEGKTPVLKLHGSTTWCESQGRFEVSDTGATPYALMDQNVEPLLGFPGPSKMSACEKGFAELWSLALTAIRNAEVVHFVGYRFPPTDTYSLEHLFEAIAASRGPLGRGPDIYVVLGPASEHTKRMEHILFGRNVLIREMFASDYLVNSNSTRVRR